MSPTQGTAGNHPPKKPAPEEGSPLPREDLRLGAQGAAVELLQKALVKLGLEPGRVDGQFGPKTEAALKAVQSTEKLTVDGLYNPKTREALERRMKSASSGPPVGAPAGAPTSAPGTAPGGMSSAHLRAIMPHLHEEKVEQYLPLLTVAMVEAEITTLPRRAAFLAQLAHESGQLRYFEETASGEAYEGRSDLGNTQKGDGVRYKGRGPIQLTGRTNYQKAGEALGVDLEGQPHRAADPDVGFRVACWFWKLHGLNALADAGQFDTITRRINGGLNGKADRDAYHQCALKVLADGHS